MRRQIGLASCSAVTNVLFCNDCQLHGLWSNGRRWFCSIAESTCAVRYGTSTQSLLGYRSFTAAADLTMFLLAGIYSLLCGVKIIKLNGTDWIVIHTTVENLLFSPTLRRISTTCLCLCIFFILAVCIFPSVSQSRLSHSLSMPKRFNISKCLYCTVRKGTVRRTLFCGS